MRRRIIAQARQRLGNEIAIAITEWPRIERIRNGKLRSVVSQIMDVAAA